MVENINERIKLHLQAHLLNVLYHGYQQMSPRSNIRALNVQHQMKVLDSQTLSIQTHNRQSLKAVFPHSLEQRAQSFWHLKL